MAKRFKNIVLGYTRKSNIVNRKSKYYCPNCDDNNTFNIIRLRDGWFECRACKHQYPTDSRKDEEFD